MQDNRVFEQTNPDQLLLFRWGTRQKSARKEKRDEEKTQNQKMDWFALHHYQSHNSCFGIIKAF